MIEQEKRSNDHFWHLMEVFECNWRMRSIRKNSNGPVAAVQQPQEEDDAAHLMPSKQDDEQEEKQPGLISSRLVEDHSEEVVTNGVAKAGE